MINLYLRLEDIPKDKNIIKYNDAQFAMDSLSNTFSNNISDIKNIIKNIENAELVDKKNIKTELSGIQSIDKLSSGCKTAINIINNPNSVVNIIECGNNAILEIFKNIKDGNIYMPLLPASNKNYNTNVNLIFKNSSKQYNDISSLLNACYKVKEV